MHPFGGNEPIQSYSDGLNAITEFIQSQLLLLVIVMGIVMLVTWFISMIAHNVMATMRTALPLIALALGIALVFIL
jgi:hypothetical protein